MSTEPFSRLIETISSIPLEIVHAAKLSIIKSQRAYCFLSITIFCLSISIGVFAVIDRIQSINQMEMEVKRLLTSRREPYRSGEYGGLSTIVLSLMNNTERKSIPTWAQNLLNDYVIMANRYLREYSSKRLRTKNVKKQLCSPQSNPADVEDIISDYSSTHKSPKNEENVLSLLKPCYPSSPDRKLNKWSWGGLNCVWDTDIRVGSAIIGVASHRQALSSFYKVSSEGDIDKDDMKKQLEIEARGLLAALPIFEEKLQHAWISEPEGKIIQSYFVGIGGIIAEWDKSPNGNNDNLKSPLHHWESSSYIQRLLNSFESTQPALVSTYPYLDMGGHGLIRTYCRAIYDDFTNVPCLQLSNQVRFLGGFCIDEQIVHELPLKVGAGKEISAGNIKYEYFSNKLFDYRLFDESNLFNLIKEPFTVFDSDISALHHWIVNNHSVISSGKIVTQPLLINSRSFLLPLGGYSSRHSRWVYVTTNNFRVFPRLSILAVVLLILSLYFLSKGTTQARIINQEASIASTIRCLNVAVVTIDENSRIINANDRAEILFNTVLPKFGQLKENGTEVHPIYSLDNHLEKGIRFRFKYERPNEIIEILKLERVRELARSGFHIHYYAKLIPNNIWIRVNLTPFKRNDDGVFSNGKPRTLASVHRENPIIENQLNLHCRKYYNEEKNDFQPFKLFSEDEYGSG